MSLVLQERYLDICCCKLRVAKSKRHLGAATNPPNARLQRLVFAASGSCRTLKYALTMNWINILMRDN